MAAVIDHVTSEYRNHSNMLLQTSGVPFENVTKLRAINLRGWEVTQAEKSLLMQGAPPTF